MNARRITCSALQTLLVVSTALVTAHANAQLTLYDNLDNVPFDRYWYSPLGPDRLFAQQFLVGDIAVVDSVTVKIQRTGSGPTGIVGLELWRDNGSDEPLPVGDPNSIVAEIGTIDDVTQLPEKTFTDVEFGDLGLQVEPNTPYWVVMDFSAVSGISGEHQSIGWGLAVDKVPPGEPLPPLGYDPTLGTNGAAFTHFYRNADPFWQVANNDIPPEYFYVSMAVEAVTPRCDFDGNGTCNITDLDALLYDGQSRQILDPYDLNSDGVVGLGDRDEWNTLASAQNGVDLVPGDTNLDGMVVASDLNDLGTNWQRADATSVAQGDFNGDGFVGAADLNDVGLFWQHGAAIASAVPEPSGCLALLASMALCLASFRRR